MVLVDSSVWIEYFNGTESPHTDFLDEALGSDLIAVGDMMLTEILQGFRRDADFRTARRLLLTLPVFEIVGEKRAIKAAENYRYLRKRGVTVRKTIDALIATFCIEEKHALLYTDRDFDPFVQYLDLTAALP